jgi:hypothetical protein
MPFLIQPDSHTRAGWNQSSAAIHYMDKRIRAQIGVSRLIVRTVVSAALTPKSSC